MNELEIYHKKVYCTSCNNKTNHQILSTYKEEDLEEWWYKLHILVKCLGCDTGAYITEYADSDYVYGLEPGESVESVATIKVYPPEPVEEKKYQKKHFDYTPILLKRLYSEAVQCYDQGMFFGVSAILRMIIEGLCKDLCIEDGFSRDKNGNIEYNNSGEQKRFTNLYGKINGLEENGILTRDQIDTLHMVREMGNQTVHELKKHTKWILLDALEIIEFTLTNVYELKKFEQLKEQLKK